MIDELEAFQSAYRIAMIPRTRGCYIVLGDGKPVYVGSSRSLSQRVNPRRRAFDFCGGAYHTPWGKFQVVEIRIKEMSRCTHQQCLAEERRLIRLFQPIGNVRDTARWDAEKGKRADTQRRRIV